jgi:transcriptional regulator with XRE-family HTH domain
MRAELKNHRMASGMSLRKAARALKVHTSTVLAWEHGINRPQPRMIPRIADVYRIDPMRIVEWIQPPQISVAR